MENVQSNSLWGLRLLCGNKTRIKVYVDTVLIKFPLFYTKSRKETRIDVVTP